ncbi:MAG: hypothetical protein E7645_04285 [Ruminococcaceae bacterium]|nr:hypothetical protein [Oscillospiraceae bacterium]
MKSFKQLLISALACATLLTTVACTGSNPPDETLPTTNAPTETMEESVTDAFTEALPEDFEITESNGEAAVFTPTGLKYKVTGYTGRDAAHFAFDKTLTVTFPEGSFAEAFNRFSMIYKATEPVKVTIAYKVTKYDVTDYYFLEAGEGVFSGLPSSFMNEADCFSIASMTVEALTDKATEFTLAGLTTEKIPVPNNSLYIENDRFKLGIDMGWGGTINYIKDKNATIASLRNLVNKHDTGRLIQQSFYGTGPIEGVYEPGISFDTQWNYNPVQGGDQYNNSSRLIDLVVTETSVYIKSQPQDWSLDNKLTPSYMENTYTLKNDHIQVDNRFVDFSGWEHPHRGQELPALYTVSYLDTFVWYDGDASWTNDTLSSRDDLNFWGDSRYVADCTFSIKESNQETWCAWVNTADNYGLGIYVPKVDQFKAGRYEYDGSKDAMGDSTNYVAPVNMLKLVSFKPLEYSYILTAGSLEEIRSTFTTHKDFSTNASLNENYISLRVPSVKGDITKLIFDSQNNVGALTNPFSTTTTYDEAQNAAKLVAGPDGDVNVTVAYSNYTKITADTHKTLKIEYMIPTDNSSRAYECDLFLCAGTIQEASGDARLRKSLIVDGEYHILEIDLSAYSFWKGDIHKIRFDYFDFSSEGDVMFVKSITLE